MTAEIVDRVLRSARYHDVDPGLLGRLAAEELPRARSTDDAVKRVKRRLHQAIGAFRGATSTGTLEAIREAWAGDLEAPAFRAACAAAMRGHASTRERLPHLDGFYRSVWALTGGPPAELLDIGCGLGPLALPWMGLTADARLLAVEVDRRPLATVEGFLRLVGQPHRVEARDIVADPPQDAAEVALLLKVVTTLDRQDPSAATRLLRQLAVRHVVVSFTSRSLSGRATGMERTYRERLDRLVAEAGRVTAVAEASVPNELVFVLTLADVHD